MTREIIVAWYGPDGAGKSTLADRVQARLCSASPSIVVERRHWRPGLLPRTHPATQVDPTDPYGSTTRSRSYAAMLDIMVALDFSLWWAGHVVRSLSGRGRRRVVLWERYLDDGWLDPARYRRPGRSVVLRCAARWLPRVDLVVVVGGDPATIAARKSEASPNKVARTLAGLATHSFRSRDELWLDTTRQDVDACVQTILTRLDVADA